jgi:hypothetical protein
MTSSAAQRRRSAYAAAAAAKQRRQKIMAIVGFVLLIAVMAYEVPKVLNRGGGPAASSSSAPPPSSVTTQPKTLPKSLRTGSGADPFVARTYASSDSGVGPALPGRDPFATAATQAADTQASAPPPLPETIVIGTPTASGATVHGWIVILASIPTGRGQASAEAFARSARRDGIGAVGVLNSSNRKPLRGGYWVVYTGPVRTVSTAENLASSVHANGYRAAYVRELIEYK